MAFDGSSIREDTLVTFHWSYSPLLVTKNTAKMKYVWSKQKLNPLTTKETETWLKCKRHQSSWVISSYGSFRWHHFKCMFLGWLGLFGIKLTKIAETQYTSNAVEGLITLFHIRVVSKCYVRWHHSQCNLHLFERRIDICVSAFDTDRSYCKFVFLINTIQSPPINSFESVV